MGNVKKTGGGVISPNFSLICCIFAEKGGTIPRDVPAESINTPKAQGEQCVQNP